MAIERVESGIAKKWEFIYMKDYDEDGTSYPLRKGRRYIVHYDTNKNETYTDEKNNILIRRNNHTLYSQYKKVKSISREVYLKPYQIYLTEKMIKKGTITRYFVKYILDKEERIFEVSKQGFQTASRLYKKVSLDWSLTGNMFEVAEKNRITLLLKERLFKGIRDFLDPLDFYQKVLTPKDVVSEKLKRLKQQDSGKDTKGTTKSSLKSKGSKLKTTVAPPRSQPTTRTTSRTGTTGY